MSSLMSFTAHLPLEVWQLVFELLTPPDLLALACANTTFNNAIIPSTVFCTWRDLCPGSRKPLALTWQEVWWINHVRRTPLSGDESIHRHETDHENERTLYANLLATETFPEIIIKEPGRKLIDLTGSTSARDSPTQYIADLHHTPQGDTTWPRSVISWRFNIRGETRLTKGICMKLPPDAHLVRPSGEQLVGGTLFWIEDNLTPLRFTQTEKDIQFHISPDGGEFVPSAFANNSLTMGGESADSPYSMLISRWLRFMRPSHQMFSGVPALKFRQQKLRIYNVFDNILQTVDVRELLGLEIWKTPWILPMGFDSEGNLIVKIVDSNPDQPVESCEIRIIQRNFDIKSGQTRWSIDMKDAISSTPWDTDLYNDHCCGYVCSRNGKLYAQIHDLREGRPISTIGPFPDLLKPVNQQWQCILTSFYLIFHDRSRAMDIHAYDCAVQSNPTPLYLYRVTTGECLYKIDLPSYSTLFEPPRSWFFCGEDVGERYMIFNGIGKREIPDDSEWPEAYDGSKKWLILDTVRREWLFVTSVLDRWLHSIDGVHALYRDGEGDSIQGLRFQFVRLNTNVF